LHLVRLGVGKRCKQLRSAGMLAVDCSSPRLDIGQRRVARGKPDRSRGRRKGQQSSNRGGAKQLTCSGNLALRRLQG
jgi:hypothetical protein